MKLDIELYKRPARGWDGDNFLVHYSRLVQGLLTNLTRRLRIADDVESYKVSARVLHLQPLKVSHGLNNSDATLVLMGRVVAWRKLGQDANSITILPKLLTTKVASDAALNQPDTAIKVEDADLFAIGDTVSVGNQQRTVTSVAGNVLFLNDSVSFASVVPVYLVTEKTDILVL